VFSEGVQDRLRFYLDHLNFVKMAAFQVYLQSGKQRQVRWTMGRRHLVLILIVGFCILLRVYPVMLFLKPPYATMFFVLDFIVHYLLHVSAPIGGHLQVKCTQNIY
jgi:hypothetical protein